MKSQMQGTKTDIEASEISSQICCFSWRPGRYKTWPNGNLVCFFILVNNELAKLKQLKKEKKRSWYFAKSISKILQMSWTSLRKTKIFKNTITLLTELKLKRYHLYPEKQADSSIYRKTSQIKRNSQYTINLWLRSTFDGP